MSRPNSYVYLASPYSSNKRGAGERMVEEAGRYHEAMRCFVWFTRRHVHVYSPIVHCHPARVKHGLPGDAAFWIEQNTLMIDNASGMLVLCLPGWRESLGVQAELGYAVKSECPVTLVHPKGVNYSVASYQDLVPEVKLPGIND